MQIPLNQSQPSRPPLELVSIKLYSTGLKKVFTNHFYKSMNHNFGVEILVKNNTNQIQIKYKPFMLAVVFTIMMEKQL